MNKFEPVIGLEVHVELETESKMFCRCPNIFGKAPNSLICPVCMGLPGVLPVLNKKALDLGTRAALALNCRIQKEIVFERKNYFYPDLPKGYQISQYVSPLGEEGFLEVRGRKVAINRVHLEEDAGKLIHKDRYSLVDLNRAGVPLLEIVSCPDLFSPEEAFIYLKELKLLLRYVGISNCDMEKGFLRCDANVSIKPKGRKELGVRTELKNMNSFSQVKEALAYEIKRQSSVLEEGSRVFQETRLWDEKLGKTKVMRSKEGSHDYRYFPEPDLVRFSVTDENISRQKELIGELPAVKKARFIKEYSLSENETEVILSSPFLGGFFEECLLKTDRTKKVVNWITGPLLETVNSKKMELSDIKVSAGNFVSLVEMMDRGEITNLTAKAILSDIIDKDADPEEIVREKGLSCVSNESELTEFVNRVIAENPKAVEDYKVGKSQALMFLVGRVMKLTQGKANPNKLKELFKSALS